VIDSELGHYLSVTAEDIKRAAGRYLDGPNRVVLDIVPAPAADVEEATAASPQPPAEAHQPGSPAAQIPDVPAPEPESPVQTHVPQLKSTATPEQPKDPADVKPPTESGPLHV
jgi:hypothetical protein